MKMTMMQLNDILQNMTSEQKAGLALHKADNSVMYSAETIHSMMCEYAARYINAKSINDFIYKWLYYNNYKIADLQRAYDATYSTYNPIDNYSMTESTLDITNHGDITRTRSVDDEHNTVTTANNYDFTQTTAAGEDTPTTSNYITTDDDTSPRLQSQSTTTGETTVNTAADINDNYTTVTDDMTITNAETHTQTSMTVDGNTVSGDTILSHKTERTGNIGTVTSQNMITQEQEIRQRSLVYDYVYDFIAKYTFYAMGGECYEYIY